MIDLKIKRRKYTDKQVVGTMLVYKDNIFVCSLAVLEPPWLNNKKNISCIPKDVYIVEHYSSEKHPNSFIIKGVENRTYILFHKGNRFKHSLGCILAGYIHSDYDKDGYRDVIHSGDAMNMLNRICENEKIISLTIE